MTDTIALREIAHARSGDKGDAANVGVIAYTQAGYEYLDRELTEARVSDHLSQLPVHEVRRFAMPGIMAYNFVLPGVLGGGASRSLRIDSQGKVLALSVLEIRLPKPSDLEQMLPPPSPTD